MADATLRDLSADTDIGTTDVMPKQGVSGPLNKITGANIKAALESGGGIALSLVATQRPAAGADTRVQYNNSTVTAGDADLVWDDSGKALQIGASTVTAQLKLPTNNSPGAPALAIGDHDSGLFEATDDVLVVSCGGSSSIAAERQYLYTADNNSNRFASIRNVRTNSNIPTLLPNREDINTGVARPSLSAADDFYLAAGGVTFVRCREATADEDFFSFRTDPLTVDVSLAVSSTDLIPASFMTAVIDETNNQLEFWVKYADGVTVKAGAVNLT